MAKLLNETFAPSIAQSVIEAVEDLGYPIEELLPGIALAVVELAKTHKRPDQILDEIALILADVEV